MSDALILFAMEKKENSLFLMQKQTPREARNRQRTETTIDREALRFYNDRHWSICLFDKSQSWTFKTSNICWRVRIINLSHWLFSINIPQAQAREHIRKTTPRPDMRTSGYGSMRTRGHGNVRTRGDKDDKDMWIVNCDLAGEPSGVRVENW